MAMEGKDAILLTQDKSGQIKQKQITQKELGKIFFREGNKEWDQIHLLLPEPKWERLYDAGRLVYEGYSLDHKAYGAGRAYYENGNVSLEGIFGIKGLL